MRATDRAMPVGNVRGVCIPVLAPAKSLRAMTGLIG